ncbi:cardiolipin synthase [Thermostilla marina]
MTWEHWAAIHELSKWLICLVMWPIVVLRKERPATALAWLALIFLAPWPGVILYLLIGENRLGRRRLARRRATRPNLETPEQAFDRELLVPDHAVGSNMAVAAEYEESLARLVCNLGGPEPCRGNRVTFLADAELVIDRLIADIDAAEDHVHLLFFIFRDDDVGRRVAEALVRAKQRGATCRVLADGVGSRRMFRTLGRWMRAHGVEVHPILPVRIYRLPFARLDLRDHRKLAVVDGRTAYVGSQNIVTPDYGHPKAGSWRDVTARVHGPIVLQLQSLFTEAWYHETGELLDRPDLFPPAAREGETVLQLVPSGPDQSVSEFRDALVNVLFSARKQITITSPYFVPDDAAMLALRLAAARGVEVNLVTPRRTDHPLVDTASRYYWERLHREGVNVYLHHEGMLHAKTLTVDGVMGMFGSGNYDIRSFELNFELNVIVHSAACVEELVRLQRRYMAQARKTTDADLERRFARRVAIHTAKLAAPLL